MSTSARISLGRNTGFFHRRAVLAEFGFVLGRSVRSSKGNDPLWGAGFKFGFNDHLALRLEAERYDVADTHLNTVTAGLKFKF